MRDNSASAQKIIIVGWDGATWNYIDPLLAEGRLPNLAKLLPEGTRCTLRSTAPPYTNVAWPSLVTGLSPVHNGVYDATASPPDTYDARPTNLLGYRGAPIWRWLNHLGFTCGVLNVPMTFPAQPIDGYIVTGFDSVAQSPDVAYPPGILEQWGERGYPYTILHEEIALMDSQNPHQQRGELADFVARWEALTQYQGQVVRQICAEWPVDMLFVVFSGTDSINHRTHDRAAIGRIYEAADSALGEIMRGAGEQTLLCLLSDHGSIPATRYISLYRALHGAGWLKFQPQIASRYLQRLPAPLERILPNAWRQLPPALKRLLSWPLLVADGRLSVAYDNIDWHKTTVYARTGMGALYINRKGHRPAGTVSDDLYEPLRDEVIAFMQGLRDEQGNLLFSRVRRHEEIYPHSAPEDDDRPDLMFEPQQWSDHVITGFPQDPLSRQIPDDTPYGTHTPDGILFLSGPGIRRAASLEPADITDVMPTILAAAQVPIPQNVDGRVLHEAFLQNITPEWAPPLPPQPTSVKSSAGDGASGEEIAARLRALGYME